MASRQRLLSSCLALAVGLVASSAEAEPQSGDRLASAPACQPPSEAASAPLSDEEAVERLRAMSLEYVETHREPGLPTIRDSNGKRGTRANLLAAITLAETGALSEAARILPAALDSQETDPASPVYGYFPESTGEKPRPGHEIWTLYDGIFLLVLLDRHGERLGPALRDRMRRAAFLAARAVSRIPPPFANTAQVLLQSFIVLRAGEVAGDGKLRAAGGRIWNAFYRYTLRSGLPETNSPNYTKVHLYALGLIADEVQDARVRTQARFVRRLVWWSVTDHYHAATRQLAGPFMRTFTDRMAYELSGIHFSLFRESGGRIALPPAASAAVTWPERNAEQPLHAVLATLSRASWPKAWVDLALSRRRGLQFRERLVSWPQPGREGSEGFHQITTFMTACTALGSRNRDLIGMTEETRDVVAYAAAPDGDVGVFRLRIDPPADPPKGHVTRIVAVQQKSALAAAVIGDRYAPARRPTMTFALEWRGTPLHRPSVVSGPGGFGKTIVVDWMGARMRVRLTPLRLGSSLPRIGVVHPDPETLRLVWRGRLPRQRPKAGGMAAPVVTLALSLDLEDRVGGGRPRSGGLRLARVLRERGGWYRLSWSSPQGLLESRFLNALDAESVHERMDGVAIRPAPIQASLPR